MKETCAVSLLKLWSIERLLDHKNVSNPIHHVEYTKQHDNKET